MSKLGDLYFLNLKENIKVCGLKIYPNKVIKISEKGIDNNSINIERKKSGRLK